MNLKIEVPDDVISPIYEHKLDGQGRGMAGFTVNMDGKPFANHIRFFTNDSRSYMLEELNKLRNDLVRTLSYTEMENPVKGK